MVTITKEERAALRELVASVTLPLPWKSDSDGVIVSDLHDFVADCDGTGGDFIDPKPAKLIAGAVNALPKALDALDAADKRIADLTSAVDEYKRNPLIVLSVSDEIGTLKARIVELETEQGELHRELARLRGQLATAREDASEMEKKAIAEGSEVLALRAEVAALKASTTVVHVDESLRMAMDREIASLKRRIADLEADSACAERALIVARDAVLKFGNRPDHWAGPLLTKHIAAALIERAAFELGAIEASDCHHFKPESEK